MPENIGRNVNRYRTLWYPAATGCVAKPRLIVTDAGLEVIPIPYRTREELIDAVARGTVIADLTEHEYWGEETRMEWIRPSGLARLVAAIYAYQRRDVPHLYADPSADPYRVTREILAAFVHEAKAAGATHAAVLILPRQPDVEGYEPGRVGFWKGMEGELTNAGIDVIDPFDAFIDAAYPSGREPRLADLFEVSHYSREGNAIVASAVAAWLERSFPDAVGRPSVRAG